MATLGDLKTRIITELSKDDLEDVLAAQLLLHIQRACEYYSDERFWFNHALLNGSTVGGVATVSLPAGIRRVDRVSIPSLYSDLRKTTLEGLEQDDLTGVPDWFAHEGGVLRLYPIPDQVYTLRIVGTAQIDAPSDDSDESVWTNEARDLITAHTKMTLCRDQYRDPEGTQLAMGAVNDALARLRRETAQQLETPLRSNDYAVRHFNINRGW